VPTSSPSHSSEKAPAVTKFVLEESPTGATAVHGRAPGWIEKASWLVAPLILGAIVVGLLLVRFAPGEFFTILLVLVGAVPIVWILTSVFFPAHPDRRCPDCTRQTLEPIREQELTGLRCSSCGYTDIDASTWKFVEEGDRPLEPLVLDSRSPSSLSPYVPTDRGGLS
jgi:hypothetical protein